MSNKKALIVEDELLVAEDLKERLERFGFQNSEIALTDEEAIAKYKQFSPDLVLMDIKLGRESNGVDVAKKIQKMAETPVIFVTAYADKPTVSRALQANPYGYVLKPFTDSSLYTAINVAMVLHKIQKDFKEKSEWLEAIVTNIPGIILYKDLNYRYHTVTKRFNELYNQIEREVAGKTDFDIFPYEIAIKIRDEDINLRNRKVTKIEKDFYNEKYEKWFHIIKIPMWNKKGEFQGILISIKDITESKIKEENIRLHQLNIIKEFRKKNHALYEKGKKLEEEIQKKGLLKKILQEVRDEKELILNSITDCILYLNKSLKIKWANKASERIIGLSVSKIIGLTCRELPICDGRCKDECPLLKCIKEKEFNEKIIGTKNTKYWHLRVFPVCKETNKLRGILITIRDITEKKILEEKVARTEKMEALGRLAGGITHDFNNILTVIKGYSELILQEMDKNNPFYNDVKEIFKASKRATELVEQIREFYKKTPSEKEIINLNEFINSSKSVLDHLIKENITINLDLNRELKYIECTPSHIQQILINLVLNSRDAMPEGGTINIKTENVYIENGYTTSYLEMEQGDYVMLEVSDTGIGMDEDTIKKIFEPFYTTKKNSGTGFGLSTVYGIVKQYRGGITVDSQPGKGTSFKIFLPVSKKTPEQKLEIKDTIPLRPMKRGVENILVIDDEVPVTLFISRILQKNGYRVTSTNSSRKALQIINDNPSITLAIIDLVMPDISGPELARKIKENFPWIKIIFISGYPDIIGSNNAKIEHPVLQKPIEERKLLKLVRRELGNEY